MTLRKIILLALGLLIAAQLLPVHRDNPPIDPAKTIFSSYPTPADVHAILARSCKDCHSNETTWPWYSHLAPVSWIVAHDVHEGRNMMNFSDWADYSDKRKISKLDHICEKVRKGDMPDSKYTFIHRDAMLSAADRNALCAWTDSAGKSVSGHSTVQNPSGPSTEK
jgi:hypothetical protein